MRPGHGAQHTTAASRPASARRLVDRAAAALAIADPRDGDRPGYPPRRGTRAEPHPTHAVDLVAGLTLTGLVDIASIAACELRNLGGVLAFSAEWGDGAGGFASEGVTFSATSRPAWAGVADFDGDGFDDVMTAREDNSKYYESYLDFHRSRGDRTFEAPLKFWTELDPPGSFIPPPIPPSAATLGLVFGDVDGDGADDVVFQGFMLAVVQVAGETQYLEMFDVAWDEDTTQVVSAFDLNEDGRLDFLVWDVTEGAYALMSSA